MSVNYDPIAKQYLMERAKLGSDKYVHKLLNYLKPESNILDLGCGAGVPVDNILLKAGHSVMGIDISREQIKLARQKCRGGRYEVGDICELKPGQYKAEAIVSFYTMFHIPREKHLPLLKVMASYLRPGGWLLISMGEVEFQGEHMMYGRGVWASQYGRLTNCKMIKEAGYRIFLEEIDRSGGENHQIIMAKKLGR